MGRKPVLESIGLRPIGGLEAHRSKMEKPTISSWALVDVQMVVDGTGGWG